MNDEERSLPHDLVPAQRQQEILRRAALQRIVKVRDLAAALGVHEMTIRRDLEALAEHNLVERVHGGARINNQSGYESGFHIRASSNTRGKERIARTALTLVNPGDTLAFDASTTALTMVHALAGRDVTCIVISLDAATALASMNIPYILVGGAFHAPARSFVGPQVRGQLERLHPDKVFFSAKGYSIRSGFTDAHLAEVEVKERLIASAGLVVGLLDASKFGKEALGTIVTAEDVDIVVTDERPDVAFRDAFELAGVRLLVDEGLGAP